MKLKDIYIKFPSKSECVEHLENIKWNNIPVCPYCKYSQSTIVKKENRHHCNNCNTPFSVTIGTIFHKTKCDLQKWFYAIYIVLRVNKFISARQLAKEINVTKDTALSILNKIRNSYIKDIDFTENIIKNFD